MFWNNVRFGGGLGLSFGSDFFSGTIAPSAIYEFNNSLLLVLVLMELIIRKNYYESTIFGASIN